MEDRARASEVVYVRGTFRPAAEATVSVLDHGLLYGDGVFEGIRAYRGRVFKLERHVDRLFDSAKAIRLDIPNTPEDVAGLILETCRRNAIVDGYIRVVVTRGAGDLGIDPRSCARPELIVIARRIGALYARKAGEGVSLVTSALRRPSPDALSPAIKSLNYLNNVLARFEANDRGADEALLLDTHGFVAEATADNIFLVAAGGGAADGGPALITPPTSSTLKGITRETVLTLATTLGFTAEERPVALFDLWTAREAFMCGTMAEIVPIASIDGRPIGTGGAGTVTMRVLRAYEELVRSTGTPIYEAEPAAVLTQA